MAEESEGGRLNNDITELRTLKANLSQLGDCVWIMRDENRRLRAKKGTQRMNNVGQLMVAIADPDSPIYGSDLVPLLCEILEETEALQVIAELLLTLRDLDDQQAGDDIINEAISKAEAWMVNNAQ